MKKILSTLFALAMVVGVIVSFATLNVSAADHEHIYETTAAVKATLSENGQAVKACSECGKLASKYAIKYVKTVKLSETSYTYNGKVKTPTVTVKDSVGKTLKKDTDYTVSYASGRKNVGTYNVTVKLIGKYSGTKTVAFKIVPAKADKFSVKLSKTSYTYNGIVKKPSVTVKTVSGKTLKKGTDYSVTYPNGCKNAGTYKVTVKMKGNYTGTKTTTFKINPIKIAKCKLSLSTTEYTYNGSAKTPSVVVKNASGKTLKKGIHYSVIYASGRKGVGTYKVTVKMKGNYTGSKELSYKILPVAKKTVTVLAGGTGKVGAKSNKTITYLSSNSGIAKVNTKGVITGVKAGTATITVKSNGVSQKVTVKVENPSVTITNKQTSMYIADTLKMQVTKKPSSATVSWSVNNTNIATISSSGNLKALKEGTVTVTAKITYNGKTYSDTHKIKISVEYPEVSIFISQKTDYTDIYAFNIDNEGNSSLKIMAKGYVYCYGESENISSLSDGEGFYDWVSIKPGNDITLAAILEDDLLFWSDETVYMNIYLEYKGETFVAKCRTSRSGLDKNYELTWMKD